MDKKLTGILSYLTPIGWIIAFLAGDKAGAKTHLNQGLVLIIADLVNMLIGKIPLIGGIISWVIWVLIVVLTIMGIVYAATDKDELPIIGSIKILK